ncbi:MAG: bacterial transcriptional activator domain-containing protein, partial [Acidimicrobiales bacterium]
AEETLTAAYGRPVTDEEITPYWNEIIETNRERLVTADPDLVHPGQTFDVVLPPLADEIVIGPTAVDSPVDAEGISGDDVRQLGSAGAGTGGASGAGDAVTAPGEAEWVSLEDPASDGTLKPFEPAESDGGGSLDGSSVALGVFGTAVGAGALLELLRRRRAGSSTEHAASSPASGGPTGAAGFEARIRPIANTDAVRWLAATNRYLTHQLSSVPSDRPLPAVLAMRAGEFGIEVLLDEPSPAPAGFVADGDTGAAWRVRADLELDAIEAAGRGAPPYSPALLPVGETDAGDLLVDFEQLAVMSLVGDIGTIAGWLATVATSATAMSWSQSCSIVAIGVQTVLGGSNQVRVPTDIEAWADETIAEQTDLARNANTSTYRQRLEGGEAVFGGDEFDGPTIVLLGPGHDDLARRLMAVAELAYSSLVVITTTALEGHARIELQPKHGVVIPDESGLRLDFDPIVTGSATVRYAAEIVGDGGDQRYADFFDTVRRRSLGPGDESDEAFAAPEWPAPAPVERPTINGSAAANAAGEPAPSGQVYREPVSEGSQPAGDDEPAEVWPPPAPSAIDLRSPRLEVLEPRPIEARVLTALPSIVGLGPSSALVDELLVYLAVQRSATAIELGRLFFANVAPEDHERLLAEELGALDAAARRDDKGRYRVWFDEPSGRYWVGGDIESDHHRFVSLVALADQSTSTADEQACLEAAMGLVDDEPGRAVGGSSYRWIGRHEPTRSALDTAVVFAARRLGDLALDADRAEVARWSAAQGLIVVPGDEALHRVQMRAAAMLDDRQGVEDAYRAAVEVMEDAGSWDGLQPETDALYRQLVDPLTERS